MKVKVITPFIDKVAKKTRVVDEVFECSKERYAEIKNAGRLVVPVKEEKPTEKNEAVGNKETAEKKETTAKK